MTRPWLLIASTGVTVGALFGWAGAVACCLVAGIAVALTRQRWVTLGVVALVVALVGAARVEMTTQPNIDPGVVASTHAEGTIQNYPQSGPSGPRAVLHVESVRTDEGAWTPASGDVLVFFGETVPSGIGHGDRVRVRWEVTALEGYDPGFRRFILSGGTGAGAWSFDTAIIDRGGTTTNVLIRLRDTVTQRIEHAIDGDAGALIAGFVTGDDSGLSDETRRAFDLTNTSHITAVSGSNVAVLLSMWFMMVPTSRLQRSIVAQIAILVVVWSYVVLVGMGPGAVRAGLFATILLPAPMVGRKGDPLTALMTASALMLLVSPQYAQNVGFWLSMAASAAMVTSLAFSTGGAADVLKQGIVALIAAQIATFPVTIWVFDRWSLGSLVANLLIGPLVSLMFPVAFFTALLVTALPWAGGLVAWIPKLGADLIISIVESISGEFPSARPGPVNALGVGLLAVFSATAIAGLSVDVRRWVMRLAHRRESLVPIAPAIMIGASLGVWVTVVVVALWW